MIFGRSCIHPWRWLDFWHAPGVILEIPTSLWQFSSNLHSTKWMKQLNRVKRQIHFQRFLLNVNPPGNNAWLFHAVRDIDFWFFSLLLQNTPLRGVSRDQWDSGTPLENPNKSSPVPTCTWIIGKHYFPNSGLVFQIILEKMLTLAAIQHFCISDWNPDKAIGGFPEQDLQE